MSQSELKKGTFAGNKTQGSKVPLSVAIVAAEVVPFAKAGGVADVVGALPKELEKIENLQARVFMPKHKMIDEEKFGLEKIEDIPDLNVPIGQKRENISLFTSRLPNSEVEVYFIGNDTYFDRDGIYTDPKTGLGYPDNAERFIFFSRATLEVLKALQWKPDVLHCNDYHVGLIPAYLKTLYASDPFFKGIATLYSIHNLEYQGVYPKEIMELTGFGWDMFYPMSPFEYWGQINFMKVGLVYADLLNTVSERYAEEIQSGPEYGCGLEGVLRDRSEDLFGIVNGIDYEVWNPEIDELIPYKYSFDDLSGKRKDKEKLLEENNLPLMGGDIPLIGVISRLVDQKGFDLVAEIADEMMSLDIQFVLLGTGLPKYHKIFTEIGHKYPSKAGINLTFNNALAHRIEASADMFLMPSRFEPCGLNQLYSLKYGTIPIVRAVGGLADTIEDYDSDTGEGNGFVFEEYSSKALLETIERAIQTYKDKSAWHKLVRNAMQADFSWRVSAQKYVELYKRAVDKRNFYGQ